jgi:M6 family metalloprotease-like protein
VPELVRFRYGSRFRLQTSSGHYLRTDSAGTIRRGGDGLEVFQLMRSAHLAQFLAATALRDAAAAGHDFSRYDRNRNGVIEGDELLLMVVSAARTTGPLPLQDVGGAKRVMDAIDLPNSRVRIGEIGFVAMSEHASLATMTHELLHLAGGAVDVYNACKGNENMSLMSTTIERSRADLMKSWHLDAWHKLRLGWIEPQIYAVNNPAGAADVLPAFALNDTPIIVYDPRHYDVHTKSGEYYLIERRLKSGYDDNAQGNGLAVWHVITNSDGNLATVVGRACGGKESTGIVYVGTDDRLRNPTIAELEEHRGAGEPLRLTHGVIPLARYSGRDSGLRVAADRSFADGGMGVRWFRNGAAIRSRLDAIEFHGEGTFPWRIVGEFAVPSFQLRAIAVHKATRQRHELPVVRYANSMLEREIRIPASLPAGQYLVHVEGSDGRRSNRIPLRLFQNADPIIPPRFL